MCILLIYVQFLNHKPQTTSKGRYKNEDNKQKRFHFDRSSNRHGYYWDHPSFGST